MRSVMKTTSISCCQSCKNFFRCFLTCQAALRPSDVYGCTVVFFTVELGLVYKHIISQMEGQAFQAHPKFPLGDPDTTCAFTGKKVVFLPWDTDVDNSSRGRTREETKHVVFWSQSQVAPIASKFLSSQLHRQGFTWLLSCLLTSHCPTHMTEAKCLLFSLATFILVWARVDSQRWGWSREIRDTDLEQGWDWQGWQEAGAHSTAPKLSGSHGFPGWFMTGNIFFFRKPCLQRNLWKKNVT